MHTGADRERRILRSWTANATAWTRAVREGRITSRRAGTDAAIVDAVLGSGARRILDLGCGEGWLARGLAAHGREVVGTDASAALVEAARAAGGARFATAGYADIASGAFAPGRFDAVVFNFALLGEDLRTPLDAARACLAAGGTLFAQTVHPWSACGANDYADGWRSENFAAIGDGFAVPMPWYFRTLAGWHAAFADAGWRIDRIDEPRAADGGTPLSLLLRASPRDAP